MLIEIPFEARPHDEPCALSAFAFSQALAFDWWIVGIPLCRQDQFVEG